MVTSRAASLVILGLMAAERLAELLLSARNAARARRRGAVEAGQNHYPAMVAFHAAALATCALVALSPRVPPRPGLAPAAGVLAAQALRWWAIATLGDRWNTRILVVAGEPPVTAGPYRWLRHPNYLAVVAEMALFPLVWGAWRIAIALSVGNAILLGLRIPAEEQALGNSWASAFASWPRPRPRRSVAAAVDRESPDQGGAPSRR